MLAVNSGITFKDLLTFSTSFLNSGGNTSKGNGVIGMRVSSVSIS
jgi:hypothetical protein